MNDPKDNVYRITRIIQSEGYLDDLYTRVLGQEVHIGRADGFKLGDIVRQDLLRMMLVKVS